MNRVSDIMRIVAAEASRAKAKSRRLHRSAISASRDRLSGFRDPDRAVRIPGRILRDAFPSGRETSRIVRKLFPAGRDRFRPVRNPIPVIRDAFPVVRKLIPPVREPCHIVRDLFPVIRERGKLAENP
jgi:hypothetical protein